MAELPWDIERYAKTAYDTGVNQFAGEIYGKAIYVCIEGNDLPRLTVEEQERERRASEILLDCIALQWEVEAGSCLADEAMELLRRCITNG